MMPETDSEREALDTMIKSVLPVLTQNLDVVSVVEENPSLDIVS